ncbi:MAG TPA: tetratricopeptide repeat protein [Candidatus Binatia bacterium]
MPSIDEIRGALYRSAAHPGTDLAAAALLVAAEEYPDLDRARYLAFLDDVAERVRRELGDTPTPDHARRAMCAELFERLGFAGDTEDYYDPRNSYLNEVIDRRRGIPITLAVVYIAVGTRLGQPVYGVNAPGHFLVRHADVLLDPFASGRVVERATLAAWLAQMGVEDADAQVARLVAAPPDTRAVLVRILGNLKANHLQRKDFTRALAVVDRLVHLDPTNPLWLRDRGALYQRLDCPHAAVADFERYLRLVPNDPEGDVIREALVKLKRQAPTLQ